VLGGLLRVAIGVLVAGCTTGAASAYCPSLCLMTSKAMGQAPAKVPGVWRQGPA